MSRQLDSETPIRPACLAHYVLRVRNMEESITWYETVVSMELVQRGDKLAFLTETHYGARLIDHTSFQMFTGLAYRNWLCAIGGNFIRYAEVGAYIGLCRAVEVVIDGC